MSDFKDIIELVQQRRELQFLSEDFIIMHASEIIRLDKKLRTQYEDGKESAKKTIVKHVREQARKIYGVFQVILERFLATSKHIFSRCQSTSIC